MVPQFPFSFWKNKPSSGPVWPTGVDGNLIQVGGNLQWFEGVTKDYNNVSLNGVTIDIVVPGGGAGTGNPTIIGVFGTFSMINCFITGTNNGDLLYDGSGNPEIVTYSASDPAGKAFSYSVTSAQGGNGGYDSNNLNAGGNGFYGSGGGGGSGLATGTDADATEGGVGGNGDSFGGASGGFIYGNPGGDTGFVGGGTNGPGAGGGAVGLSGQNLMFNIYGGVVAFSGNSIVLSGGSGGNGGTADNSPTDPGGGGGGGAAGFGGSAQFWVHGGGQALVTAGQFFLTAAGSGAGGSGGGIGNDGNPGQDGSLVVHTY